MGTYIRKSLESVAAYAPGEQPREATVVKLNTNENPYPPSPRVLEAIRAFGVEALRRYPDPTCTALRQRLASMHGVAADQVFVGNGSDEVLTLCTRAFVERDEAIGYFDVSYSLYPVLAELQEVARRPVDLGPDFAWRMPADYQAALFFLANPNAPTGIRFDGAQVERFCRGFSGVVLIDEAYVDFAEADCVAIARALPNVLVARTLSKSYSLAGLRLGYAVGPAPLIEALQKIKDSYNVNAFTQAVGLAALGDLEYMRTNAARIKATRERARAALLGQGHQVYPSETNFLWLRPARLSAQEVFAGVRRHGIVIRYFPGAKTGDFLRVTVGTDADMDRFLAAMDVVTGRAS
ncbi:MAG: histidinol-phosphate transaminase [Lentisphaerae bacterium]|nr:histidinol-phosphate transaminase [Lentisphaerota bacterium]